MSWHRVSEKEPEEEGDDAGYICPRCRLGEEACDCYDHGMTGYEGDAQ